MKYDKPQFTPSVAVVGIEDSKNHKHLQSKTKKLVQNQGIGTRSQQALRLQREQTKIERIQINQRKERVRSNTNWN